MKFNLNKIYSRLFLLIITILRESKKICIWKNIFGKVFFSKYNCNLSLFFSIKFIGFRTFQSIITSNIIILLQFRTLFQSFASNVHFLKFIVHLQ